MECLLKKLYPLIKYSADDNNENTTHFFVLLRQTRNSSFPNHVKTTLYDMSLG